MQSLNRTLFISDNLPVLRGIDSESIDLIATDPPFNKGVKAFEGITAAGENVSYSDVWTWGDVQQEWWTTIREEHRNLYEVIDAANHAAGDDMGAFLCWLGVRVLEMRRILKPDGTIYLHCDHTAGHYLKVLMDAIFGVNTFRAAITWKRTSAHNDRLFGSQTDTILMYGGSNQNVEAVRVPLSAKNVASKYRYKDDKGTYRTGDLTGAGTSEGESGEAWKGHDPTAIGRHWAVPKTGKYAKYLDNNLLPGYLSIEGVHARLDALADADMIHVSSTGGMPALKRYLLPDAGQVPGDLWTDIEVVNSQATERTGYPTQKPLALYERMIKASSNPGDVVLDPFAGCATTCVAAERLGRQWIGIDLNKPARDIIRDRLQREVSQSMAWGEIVHTPTEPPERTDGGEAVAPELVVVSRKRNARRLPVREIRERLIISDGMRCQGCGWEPPYPDYLQVDHKKPRSLGGVDEMDNFALLCDPCNRFKSNKLTLAELRQARVEEERMNADWWQEARWR